MSDFDRGEGRHVLMVGYWYPPTPGAGAQRLAGFARHLPANGWRATVLTAGPGSWFAPLAIARPTVEDTGVRVVRAADVRPARTALRDYAGQGERPSGGALRRLVWPDRFRLWAHSAGRAAASLCDSRPPDVVWCTFPPASAAMLGMTLAARFHRPLVLDMRDPWLGPGGYMPSDHRSRARHERLEADVVRQAARVVTISDAMRDDLCRRIKVDAGRVAVIPNGFDANRCVPTALSPPSPPELVHVGNVSLRNRPDLFLDALVARSKGNPGHYRVVFVGNMSAGHLAERGLSTWVHTTGLVEWPLAWAATCRASALLLLTGDYVGRWGTSTKLFEYVRSGRPILCLEESPGSNDRRLLEQLAPGRTVFAPLADTRAVADAIDRVLELAVAVGPVSCDESAALARYDRARLTGELAAVLEGVVGRG